MNEGRIKNFTREGNVLTLTAMVGKTSGDTRYQLDTSLMFGETLTYEGLVNMLEALKADIEDVFKLGMTYETDSNGNLIYTDDDRLIPAGNGINNSHIEAFEREWGNAQSE